MGRRGQDAERSSERLVTMHTGHSGQLLCPVSSWTIARDNGQPAGNQWRENEQNTPSLSPLYAFNIPSISPQCCSNASSMTNEMPCTHSHCPSFHKMNVYLRAAWLLHTKKLIPWWSTIISAQPSQLLSSLLGAAQNLICYKWCRKHYSKCIQNVYGLCCQLGCMGVDHNH